MSICHIQQVWQHVRRGSQKAWPHDMEELLREREREMLLAWESAWEMSYMHAACFWVVPEKVLRHGGRKRQGEERERDIGGQKEFHPLHPTPTSIQLQRWHVMVYKKMGNNVLVVYTGIIWHGIHAQIHRKKLFSQRGTHHPGTNNIWRRRKKSAAKNVCKVKKVERRPPTFLFWIDERDGDHPWQCVYS